MDFLDNYIPDRIRILKTDPNPNYVHQILAKHFFTTVEDIAIRYKVSIHTIRQEITISGSMDDIYKLHDHLYNYNLDIISLQQDKIIVNIDKFLTKIY